MAEKKDLYMEQVMRCSALGGFPAYQAGMKELRDHLRGLAPQIATAREIIDQVMSDREFSPTPHDLTLIAGEVRRKKEQAPQGCEICQGQPWISIERRVTELSGVSYMESGAQRCTCTKGQWFREKDRENNSKRAARLAV